MTFSDQESSTVFGIQWSSDSFIRLDGSAVKSFLDSGGGIVNTQEFLGEYEKFYFQPQNDGSFAIASVAFPGVYLRLDGSGLKKPLDLGVVNCQFGVGPYEKFWLRTNDGQTFDIESVAFPLTFLYVDVEDVFFSSGKIRVGSSLLRKTFRLKPICKVDCKLYLRGTGALGVRLEVPEILIQVTTDKGSWVEISDGQNNSKKFYIQDSKYSEKLENGKIAYFFYEDDEGDKKPSLIYRMRNDKQYLARCYVYDVVHNIPNFYQSGKREISDEARLFPLEIPSNIFQGSVTPDTPSPVGRRLLQGTPERRRYIVDQLSSWARVIAEEIIGRYNPGSIGRSTFALTYIEAPNDVICFLGSVAGSTSTISQTLQEQIETYLSGQLQGYTIVFVFVRNPVEDRQENHAEGHALRIAAQFINDGNGRRVIAIAASRPLCPYCTCVLLGNDFTINNDTRGAYAKDEL